MTGFNHGMTGAVLALVIKQPALAVPLAFLSHFVTDMIPHFGLGRENILNRKFTIILVADFIFSIFLMVVLAVLFPAHLWLIWACMIAAASPDLMWAYHHLYRVKIKHRKLKLGKIALFHSKIQWSQTLPGIAMEACWFILMGLIILHQIA
jgi:hypothetical protein